MLVCVYAYTDMLLILFNLALLKIVYVHLWARHEWRFNFVMTMYHFCLIFQSIEQIKDV
jgi:hypothetical protein